MLRDIVNKTNIAEAKFGVDMVDLDLEQVLLDEDDALLAKDDANGDAAMNQLAALITGDTTPPHKGKSKSKAFPVKAGDAVSAILAGAGVAYVHENSEVIGTSKIESAITRHAEEMAGESSYGERRLFEEEAAATKDTPSYRYKPPEDVKERQFCSMARMFGYDDPDGPEAFGLAVERMTQEERRDCLDRFYAERKRLLERKIAVLTGELESELESGPEVPALDVDGDSRSVAAEDRCPNDEEAAQVVGLQAVVADGSTTASQVSSRNTGDQKDYDTDEL